MKKKRKTSYVWKRKRLSGCVAANTNLSPLIAYPISKHVSRFRNVIFSNKNWKRYTFFQFELEFRKLGLFKWEIKTCQIQHIDSQTERVRDRGPKKIVPWRLINCGPNSLDGFQDITNSRCSRFHSRRYIWYRRYPTNVRSPRFLCIT